MPSEFARDPIENDPATKALIDAALAEAREIIEREWEESGMNARGFQKGKTPGIWKRAAEILRKRHGIEWKDPTQMNRGLRVD